MQPAESADGGDAKTGGQADQKTGDGELRSETEGDLDGESQRSIRDMLDDEGRESVFVNRDLVEPDTIIDEERIVGRDDQLESVVSYLKPALEGNRPPNMLLYGPAGTGKSLIIGAVTEQIIDLCESNGRRFGRVSINCQPINTLDQAVFALVEKVANDVGEDVGVPETGVSTKKKYRRLYDLVNEYYDSIIFVLDEIDLLKGRHDQDEPAFSKILYQLSRASNNDDIEGGVSVAALTNDPKFMENIDGRAESSFNPRDVYFSDYNADQLRNILKNRRDAFRENALEEDVIPLIAAFAAQSHGDARKAIDLFRSAGDLADERGATVVTEDHVRETQEEIDTDRSMNLIEGLTTQKKLALFATAAVAEFSTDSNMKVPSKVGFSIYKWITDEIDADQTTRETYVKYIKEMATYGLVGAERVSKGRGGGMYMEFTFHGDPGSMMERIYDDSRLSLLEEKEDVLESVVHGRIQDHQN
jgi:cell division control protein 6